MNAQSNSRKTSVRNSSPQIPDAQPSAAAERCGEVSGDSDASSPKDDCVKPHPKEVVKAREGINNDVPQVRQERVEKLRQEIADGEFEVIPEEIADRIMRGPF